ncbi:MAG: anthranilate phosphoribosyltransferase [Candidatus Acidiferrales bacterium]
MMLDALDKIAAGKILTRAEAERVMEEILAGRASTEQIAALLMGLRMRGEALEEVVGFATAMRRHATLIFPAGHPLVGAPLVDTCGTGGDGLGTFNISTATAFVVAGAGVRVAKHGNRSSGTRCGSADVLEALGVSINIPVPRVAKAIEEIGIGFLYAPALHASTRHAIPARRELRVRTIFNLLGPLTNPARASAQVVGVYAAHLTELVAEVLSELGLARAFVVHGAEGLDEISISGETAIAELRDGTVRTFCVTPEDFGLARAPLESILGGDPAQNAAIVRSVLGNPGRAHDFTAHRDIVLMNAAAALVAAGRAKEFVEGVHVAAESIDCGAARRKLEELAAFTKGERV